MTNINPLASTSLGGFTINAPMVVLEEKPLKQYEDHQLVTSPIDATQLTDQELSSREIQTVKKLYQLQTQISHSPHWKFEPEGGTLAKTLREQENSSTALAKIDFIRTISDPPKKTKLLLQFAEEDHQGFIDNIKLLGIETIPFEPLLHMMKRMGAMELRIELINSMDHLWCEEFAPNSALFDSIEDWDLDEKQGLKLALTLLKQDRLFRKEYERIPKFAEKRALRCLAKLGQSKLSSEGLFELVQAILARGVLLALHLAIHMEEFGLFSLPANQRYDLTKIMTKTSSVSVVENLAYLRPEEWTIDQRKELFQRFVRSSVNNLSDFSFSTSLQGLKLLGFDGIERIEMISSVLQEFSTKGESKSLRDRFSRTMVKEELNFGEAPLEMRIDLLKLILSYSEMDDPTSYDGLIDCAHFGFVKTIAESPSLDLRFSLIQSIIDLSEGAAVEFITHFVKLNLRNAPVERRIDLLQRLAMRGNKATVTLVSSIDHLAMEDATAEQILALASFIADRSLSEGVKIAQKMISPRSMYRVNNPSQLIDEIKKIASKGDTAAAMIVQSFPAMGELYRPVHGLSIDHWLDLLLFLAQQGPCAARAGEAWSRDLYQKEPFRHIPIDLRLELLHAILRREDFHGKLEPRTIWDIKDFNQLDQVEERLQLAMVLSQFSPQSAQGLLIDFDKMNLEEATRWQKNELLSILLSQVENLPFPPIDDLLQRDEPLRLQLSLELLRSPLHDSRKSVISLLQKIEGGWIPLLLTKISDPTEPLEELFRQLRLEPKLKKSSDTLEEELLKQLSKCKGDPNREALIQSHYLPWCIYAATILYEMTPSEIDAIQSSNLLPRIMEFRSPSLRYPLMRQLSFLVGERPSFVAQRMDNVKATQAILWIVTSRLPSLGLSPRLSQEFFTHICKHHFFKKSARAQELCSFILALLSFRPKDMLEVNQLAAMLKKMIVRSKQLKGKNHSSNIDNFQDELQYLLLDQLSLRHSLLIHFGREVFYDSLPSDIDLRDYFTERFTHLFPLARGVENLVTKYQRTFGTFRDPKALYTYLRALKKLSRPASALDGLNRYVTAVLEGRFSDMRYGIEDHPHLEKLFSIPGLKEQWLMQEATIELDLSQDEIDNPQNSTFKEFFFQKIVVDHHIDQREHPTLSAFLQGKGKDHLHLLAREIERWRALQLSEESLKKKRELSYQLNRRILEREIIKLCSLGVKEQKSGFDSFLTEIEGINLGELQNDINQLKRGFHPPQAMSQLLLGESDDPCDLLLLGTEIEGSCLRISDTLTFNKGLLGYLLNGEVRAIIVKNSHGSMVARSVIRLLWDGKRPVILVERIYDNLKNKKIKAAIQTFAIQKAMRMGISLVSREVGSGPLYPNEIHFLGGRAPFMYSDAFSGSMRGDEPYKGTGFHTLYAPESSLHS